MTDKQKEQSEAELVGQIQTICDFINNRPETFKGVYGGVGKIIIEYAERKEQECEELKQTLAETKEIAEKRNYLDYNECLDDILQKISECEVEE